MNRIYLMPLVVNAEGAREPKYRSEYLVEGVGAAVLPYGLEPVCLVRLTDIDLTVHALLNAHADVTAVPENIDQDIDAQLTIVEAKLDDLQIPRQWVTSNTSYRSMLRVVAGIFELENIRTGAGIGAAQLLSGGVTLATKWSQLSAAAKNSLTALALQLELDTSAVTNNTTVRQMWKILVDQRSSITVQLQGEEL